MCLSLPSTQKIWKYMNMLCCPKVRSTYRSKQSRKSHGSVSVLAAFIPLMLFNPVLDVWLWWWWWWWWSASSGCNAFFQTIFLVRLRLCSQLRRSWVIHSRSSFRSSTQRLHRQFLAGFGHRVGTGAGTPVGGRLCLSNIGWNLDGMRYPKFRQTRMQCSAFFLFRLGLFPQAPA